MLNDTAFTLNLDRMIQGYLTSVMRSCKQTNTVATPPSDNEPTCNEVSSLSIEHNLLSPLLSLAPK